MTKRLFQIAMPLALMAQGLFSSAAQAQDIQWRMERSLSPTELVVPPNDEVQPYYSKASIAPTITIEVEDACTQEASAPGCRPVWRLSGTFTTTKDLKDEVAKALNQSALQVPGKVILDSQGGGVEPAMWLAQALIEDKVDTEVEDGGTCLSSCVYVLSAGTSRKVGKWALVAVHQQNSSLGLVPESIRSQGSDAISTFLDEQKETLTISQVAERLDYATHHIQHSLGIWISLMIRSGVSPALAVYASTTPNPFHEGSLTSLSHGCMQALRLDNQASTDPWHPREVALWCERRDLYPD